MIQSKSISKNLKLSDIYLLKILFEIRTNNLEDFRKICQAKIKKQNNGKTEIRKLIKEWNELQIKDETYSYFQPQILDESFFPNDPKKREIKLHFSSQLIEEFYSNHKKIKN